MDWLSKHGITLDGLKDQVFAATWRHGRKFSEDVFSEILLRLSRILREEAEKFPSGDALYRYARKAAAREARKQESRARRQQAMDPSILAGIVSNNPKSEDAPTKDELLQLLSDPTQREVLRLHLDGVEGKVIADRLGISQSKVSRKLKEAKHIIFIRYQDDWRAS